MDQGHFEDGNNINRQYVHRFSVRDGRVRALMRHAAAVLLAALHSGAGGAATPAWNPERTVEFIVPSSAGGGQDRTARIVQKIMQDSAVVASPVNVVNKPGGSGNIAYHYLSQFSGNAHYLATATGALLTSHILGTSPLNYTDFTAISVLYGEYTGFSVNAHSTIQSGKDLVERVKKNPDSITFAFGTARGAPNHIAIALVMKAAGIDVSKLKVVIYKASVEATTALMGGHVDVVATPISTYLPVLASGKIRIVAIAAPQRVSGKFAYVPTWREQGFDAIMPSYRMFIAPKGLSSAQVAFWDKAFASLSQNPLWKKELEQNEWQSNYMNSADSRKYLDARYEAEHEILVKLGLAK